MARRRAGSRRRPQNMAKKRFAWTRTLFGSQLDIAGAPPDTLLHVLFSPLTDVIPSTDYNRKWNIRRIILRGQYLMVPNQSAIAASDVITNEAVYVQDADDTDTSLLSTTAGDILEGGVPRVLYTNVQAWEAVEIPSATRTANIITCPRVEVDWKGNCKLGLEDELLFGTQLALDIGGAVQALSLQMIASVLFEVT